jgi:hypothetical protein
MAENTSDADRARQEAEAEAARERRRALDEIANESKNNRPRDQR